MRRFLFSLSILFALWLVSCDGKSKDDIYPKSDSTYVIKYFVEADSAFIWYNIDCFSLGHYVSKWDTSFNCGGGWCINIMVTTFEGSCRTGILVNGDTVDGCRCGNHCLMGFYLQ